MKLQDVLRDAHVQLESAAPTWEDVMVELVAPVAERAARDKLLSDLRLRHRLLPCAPGHGIAFPDTLSLDHPERLVSVLRTQQGINFGGADGIPIRLFFGFFGSRGFYLKSTALVSRALRHSHVRESLLSAATANAFKLALADEGEPRE